MNNDDGPGKKKSSTESWTSQYNNLISYKIATGHMNVNRMNHPELSEWISEQQKLGKQNTKSRFERLQMIGFFGNTFNGSLSTNHTKGSPATASAPLPEPTWDHQFAAVVRFKDRCGVFPKSGHLHDWLEEQRRAADSLSPERIDKLHKLGVNLSMAQAKNNFVIPRDVVANTTEKKSNEANKKNDAAAALSTTKSQSNINHSGKLRTQNTHKPNTSTMSQSSLLAEKILKAASKAAIDKVVSELVTHKKNHTGKRLRKFSIALQTLQKMGIDITNAALKKRVSRASLAQHSAEAITEVNGVNSPSLSSSTTMTRSTQFIVRSNGRSHLDLKLSLYDGAGISTLREGGNTVYEVPDDATIELVVKRNEHSAPERSDGADNGIEQTRKLSPQKRSNAGTPLAQSTRCAKSGSSSSGASELSPKVIRLTTSWLKRYNELVNYKRETGHVNVPCIYAANPGLGSWVQRQRRVYRDQQLSNECVSKLEELGFAWVLRQRSVSAIESSLKVQGLTANWLKHYNELVNYKRETGHANVPTIYAANRALGSWVYRQRRAYKDQHLSDKCISKLEELGFVWVLRERNSLPLAGTLWMAHYNQLVEHKRETGYATVSVEKNPVLGAWIKAQRKLYAKGKLSEERAAKLDKIGFVWNYESLWNQRYSELVEYKRETGHCNVPSKYPPNVKLGIWVYATRTNFRKGELLPEQIAKLNEIGFSWNAKESKWHLRYSQLMMYKREHGHCNIPQEYKPNPPLGEWALAQRKHFKNGKLSQERITKLNELGYCWDPRRGPAPKESPSLS